LEIGSIEKAKEILDLINFKDSVEFIRLSSLLNGRKAAVLLEGLGSDDSEYCRVEQDDEVDEDPVLDESAETDDDIIDKVHDEKVQNATKDHHTRDLKDALQLMSPYLFNCCFLFWDLGLSRK
jgi:hypothetical protein